MQTAPLPILGTVARAYRMLWAHRLLLAKAIWPPVVFLVTAEFLYHRIAGNARGVAWVYAVFDARWFMLLGVAVAWLAGLKFLLSFSISWRRHLLFGDRFDPFFFKRPFWRYLGFLILTYVWIVPLLLLSVMPSALLATHGAPKVAVEAGLLVPVAAVLFVIWAVVRQVPFFTALTYDRVPARWRQCVRAMRGTVWRYIAVFILAMLPVVALNFALDAGLNVVGANRHAVPVALGEAAFRQAMLFIHFALGAVIGAMTATAVLPAGNRAMAPP